MSEIIIANNGESAIGRAKKRSMLKKQRAAVILMAVAIVLLIAALFAVNYMIGIYVYPDVDGTEYHIRKVNGIYELCYKNGEALDMNSDGYYQTDLGTLVIIDPQTGDWSRYAVVDTEGTEVLDYGQKVLMFKQLTYDKSSTKDMSKVIKSIEVHNAKGSFTFARDNDNNYFNIVGHEGVPYDLDSFAQLSVSCGYTISMLRLEDPLKLEDGTVNYAEYGLAAEKRSRTETDKDGNEITVEYDYEPAWYVITTMTGESHKVYIGDMTVTETGYYARYEGRDTIYVLNANGIKNIVLEKIENMLTPTIVHPMGATTYYNVRDFIIYSDINYDGIYKALEDKYGNPDYIPDGSIDREEFEKFYNQAFADNSNKVCHFSYMEMNERQNTMYSYLPYVSELDYAGGYYINSNNIDTVLYALHATEFSGVEKLSPTQDDFEKYGLDDAAYIISYFYKTTDDEGETIFVENYVQISEKTEDGIFYAYSDVYDMIVGVSESSFGFLEWDEIEWFDTSYIQLDISYVEDVIVEAPGFKTHFHLEDSASRYMTYIAQSGYTFNDGRDDYYITKDSKTGKYVLSKDDKKYSPIYSGDYLVTPLVYYSGEAESPNYLFAETKAYDVNEDGTDDATAYYFYNVGYHAESKEYRLYAQIVVADQAGNKIGEDEMTWGNPIMKTDYFVTNSGYIYITGKTSHIGQQLEETYGKKGRGSWGSGLIFTTSDGKYVLVNSTTAEWSIMDDISCNVYFADSSNSRLAQRALKVPEIVENGKIKRYGETYYPTTNKNLRLDNETGSILVENYDKSTTGASYDECTIGQWSTGAYFATDSGILVVINEDTGDWGFVTVSSHESYVSEVFANGKLLDYVIKTTNHVNRVVDTTAMENFQQLYGGMLYASLEGMAELSEEEMAELRKHDSFDSGDGNCQLKITVLGCDFYGNRRDMVYRFYQFTERKSYITIEVLDENGESSSENGYGSFYVLRSFADKLIEDAKRMVNGEEIDAVTKY